MSANVQFLYGWLSSTATATATSTATGFAATNAVSLDRPSKWKANVATASSIQFDLGVPVLVSGVVIGNHNGTGWTGTKIQHSPDGVTWTDLVAPTLTTGQDYYFTGFSFTKQYWKVLTTSATAAMEIGVFYLGTQLTLSNNPSHPLKQSYVWNVARERSSSGAIVAEENGRRLLRVDMPFPSYASADLAQVDTLLLAESGPLRPFWYVPTDLAGAGTSGRAYLMRYEPLAFEWSWTSSLTYDFGLTLLEEV